MSYDPGKQANPTEATLAWPVPERRSRKIQLILQGPAIIDRQTEVRFVRPVWETDKMPPPGT